MTIALYPGSFNPVTVGHADIIERSSKMFDVVIVGILHNSAKKSLFLDIPTRLAMLKKVTAHLPNVKCVYSDKLLIELTKQENVNIIVRGVRGVSDFEIEMQMAQLNKSLSPNLETIFLPTDPKHSYISSTFVREIINYNGDYTSFVPTQIVDELRKINILK